MVVRERGGSAVLSAKGVGKRGRWCRGVGFGIWRYGFGLWRGGDGGGGALYGEDLWWRVVGSGAELLVLISTRFLACWKRAKGL